MTDLITAGLIKLAQADARKREYWPRIFISPSMWDKIQLSYGVSDDFMNAHFVKTEPLPRGDDDN